MSEYKLSFYNYCIKNDKNKYVVYNTLYSSLVKMNEGEYFDFINVNIENKKIADMCISNGFWVRANVDEIASYFSVIKVLRKHQESLWHLTILPTTKCNARCFYCFEQDITQQSMTDECADAIVKFISTLDKNEKIKFNWFGGEPLMNIRHIDYITKNIKLLGYEYRASMITNGLLFNEDIINRAYNDWNVRSVQITLDGIGKEYEKRKSYVANGEGSFERVISNIKMLLEKKIAVSVRMNVDKANVENIYELLQFLVDRFGIYEKFICYCAFLNECENEIVEADEKLYTLEQLIKLSKRIQKGKRNNFMTIFNLMLRSLPRYHSCLVDSPRSIIVDSYGDIYCCDHDLGDKTKAYGSIFNEDKMFEYKRAYDENFPEECKECVFLPKCFCGCESERKKGRYSCISSEIEIKAILSNI